MLSHKKSLNILRKTDALLEGHFVLSSGLHSSKYIQCARLLSHPSKAAKICKSFAQKIKKEYKKIDLILAPAMGGIVIGYEIGRLLKKETIFCERVKGKFTLRRGFEIKKNFKKFDLILAPAMGGIVIGYEIGRRLKKETIFCERIKGKFTLRRGFNIKKKSKVLIIEDVITTGKSSMECVKLIKKAKASLVGFAAIIDRSTKKNLKIKRRIVSHLKIDVPTFKKSNLPQYLKHVRITTPGSRFIK